MSDHAAIDPVYADILARNELVPPEHEPYGVEIHMADGIFIKQMAIPKAYTLVRQHKHVWDHTSMLAKGRVRFWKDGVSQGDFTAPTGLFIENGVSHSFMSLEDATVIYCCHNLHGKGALEILEEHGLTAEDIR